MPTYKLKNNRYTEEEDAYILNHARTQSDYAIALALGRTTDGIRERCKKIGVARNATRRAAAVAAGIWFDDGQPRDRLTEEAALAIASGMSYGKWKALQWEKNGRRNVL